LQEAADMLNEAVKASGTVQLPEWSDYRIMFELKDKWNYSSYGFSTGYIGVGKSMLLTAIVDVNDNATMAFNYYEENKSESYNDQMEVYLDGDLQYVVNRYEYNDQRYFVEMEPGVHEITWKYKVDGDENILNIGHIYNIGICKTPTMYVSLKEPGSLGTEVLKNTEHIKNVRKLVVRGEMNDDDWDRIVMMTSLFSLDLTDAIAAEVPDEKLSKYYNSSLSFLHEVKLPKTLKRIGKYVFYGTYLDAISFPDELETIDAYAFCGTRIKEAILPESVTMIGKSAFSANQSLETVSYPAAAQTVPDYCFSGCKVLQPFDLPEGIASIGCQAFYQCYSFDTSIPSTVSNIGYEAFQNSGITNVVVNESTTIDNYAFNNCINLTFVELPTTMYDVPYSMLSYCSNLRDVYLKSPTVAKPNSVFYNNTMPNITLHVPDYLVNAYKQDDYWYNCNIEGFNTAEVHDWQVLQLLKMGAGERFQGSPNVHISEQGSWTLSGDDAMTLNDFSTVRNGNSLSTSTLLLSTCDNIRILGNYVHKYYTESNMWYFVTLPFDTKVGDIESTASFAVRYYDGANRAKNGTGGNWKNYSKDDIIPAGTGFIFQTSKSVWSSFKAQNNDSKQFVFANKEFVKSLITNKSDVTANKGWNLVGNPWLTYYNIHKLNFAAPITVWNVSNQNYSAYSIIDDDYAIEPLQAFFVQCPDEINSISFPIDGRQLTSTIESQNAVRRRNIQSERKLVDIELSNGEMSDKTRFVLNEHASVNYETNCDASKFFSMSAEVPQIYTVYEGVEYAINERPMAEGVLTLGVKIPADGTYTIKAIRNQVGDVILLDKETGVQTLLNNGEYTFSANAGQTEDRFEIRFSSIIADSINKVEGEQTNETDYFNLNGQRVLNPTKGVYVVKGKKVIIK